MMPDDPARPAGPAQTPWTAFPPAGPVSWAAPASMPSTAPRRRRWRWLVAVLLFAVVAAGSTAAALGYAVVTRRDAQRNFSAAQQWRLQAEAKAETIDEQTATLTELQAELAVLRNEIATLKAARDSATAEADGLQALLDDATRRLGEAEARVAVLAGVQARAADQAIVSGGR